jgi:hypothetical protein
MSALLISHRKVLRFNCTSTQTVTRMVQSASVLLFTVAVGVNCKCKYCTEIESTTLRWLGTVSTRRHVQYSTVLYSAGLTASGQQMSTVRYSTVLYCTLLHQLSWATDKDVWLLHTEALTALSTVNCKFYNGPVICSRTHCPPCQKIGLWMVTNVSTCTESTGQNRTVQDSTGQYRTVQDCTGQ